MKKQEKKFVLAALALLAITGLLALAGCKNDTVPEPTRYTVKFKTDHGTAPADITVVSGTKLTAEQLKGLADTADYIFEGWYDGETKAEGGTYTVTKDVTLVAKWRDRGTVALVTFSPASGDTLYYGDTVTLSTTTDGATIQYKLDDGEWMDYTVETPISVTTSTTSTTITAKATKEGLKPSDATTATYTVRKLEGITVVTPPERTVYSVGQSFDPTGMKVTATYEGGKEQEVTGWTTNFGTVVAEKGLDKEVTVSYTEGETPKTTTFTVTVFPAEVEVLTDYESPNHTGSEWTYVAFGEWPQTIKADGVTVGESEEMGMFTYYLGDDSNYYVKHSDKYYKVEPIVWRVLTTNYEVPEGGTAGNALLLAEKILTGGIPYYVSLSPRAIGGQIVYANSWQYSTIRAWLNGSYEEKDTQDTTYTGKGFLQTAFTESAQKLIELTSVDNSDASTIPSEITAEALKSDWNDGVNPYASDTPTTDKIFLLSEKEATNSEYGFAAYDAYGKGSTRIRVTTDYAEATEADQSLTEGYGGWWWLRSPVCNFEINARVISSDGDARSDDGYSADGGVVPALSISLQ